MSASPQSPLEVVQITDAHLGPRPGGRLLGMDTDRSLGAVLALLRRQRPDIDLLLATGDLSDHGSTAAYHRFAQAVRPLGVDQMWLPGNHDESERMRACIPPERFCGHRLSGGWLVIGLDSTISGAVGGRLGESELARLRQLLEHYPQLPTLVCLHHPLLPVGCDWLDQQRVANADAVLSLLSGQPQVRVVLSGHVHQETRVRHAGFDVMTSPSTCIQFAPQSDDFRVDRRPPGYRWLRLHGDGRFETGVERVREDVGLEVDLSATGY